MQYLNAIFFFKKAIVSQPFLTWFRLNAPIIISNAGAYNTFQKLLPREISQKSYYTELLKNMEPGAAALSIFVGMDASHDELGLKAQNTWAFTSNSWSEINISCLSMHSYLNQNLKPNTVIPRLEVDF